MNIYFSKEGVTSRVKKLILYKLGKSENFVFSTEHKENYLEQYVLEGNSSTLQG